MGEVYRAIDTRLDRTVAIKIIRTGSEANHDLRSRLLREARAISQLQHPHICSLYDIGEHDGTNFLVMEYLEGETLQHRLKAGPMPMDQIVRIGSEVAEALAKAHRAGLAHRDLKPANIMLTRSGVKLLDFGLAKAISLSGADANAPLLSAALTRSTATSPLTTQGTVVGTIQYMAPEQLEGKPADARSDIFALGAVLYEMASGKRAFDGKSQLSIATAILEHDPEPLAKLRPLTPAALDHLIRLCLAKDPEERYQSALDLKLALQSIGVATPAPPMHGPSLVERMMWSLLALVLMGLGFLAAGSWRHERAEPVSLMMVPPTDVTFNFSGLFGPPAISPDGTRIAIAATNNAGTRKLFVRSFRSNVLHAVEGTDGASYPFWSPDGKQIGFFTSDHLRVADAAGGPVFDLCSISEGRGGTWNRKGDIVFGTRTTGLLRIAAGGGTPSILTRPRPEEANHRFPVFFPDGEHVAYVVQTPGRAHAQVVSLSDPRPKELEGVVSNVAFANGLIFHVRDGALVAQHINAERFILKTDRELIAKPVAFDGQFNYAAFAVAESGLVAYEEGSGSTANELVALNATGKETRTLTTGRFEDVYDGLRFSPRGDRILFNQSSASRTDVWVMKLKEGTRTRVSLSGSGGSYAVWSPNADQVVYQNGVGGGQLLLRASNGAGDERLLTKVDGTAIPQGWTKVGNHILFEFHAAGSSAGEIWLIRATPNAGPPRPLVKGVVTFGAAVSPDGKWLAYTSDESGRAEIYVIPLIANKDGEIMPSSSRWQISTDGGTQPRWGPRGDELFFVNPSQTALYSTTIKISGGDQLESGGIRKLFDLAIHPAWCFYDISPNGQIYMLRYVGRQSSPLTILVGWSQQDQSK